MSQHTYINMLAYNIEWIYFISIVICIPTLLTLSPFVSILSSLSLYGNTYSIIFERNRWSGNRDVTAIYSSQYVCMYIRIRTSRRWTLLYLYPWNVIPNAFHENRNELYLNSINCRLIPIGILMDSNIYIYVLYTYAFNYSKCKITLTYARIYIYVCSKEILLMEFFKQDH